MNYTKGPWFYDEVNGSVIIDNVEAIRFDDVDIDCKESTGRANCRLIASAPELLASLKECVNALLGYIEDLEKRGASLNYGRKVLRDALFTIDIAEGKK